MDNYVIVVVPQSDEDGGGYLGVVPDLPGCMSDGQTFAEAAENTQEAIRDWLDANAEMGRLAPQPGRAAERAREREMAFLDAMKAMLKSLEAADGEIAYLERQVAHLNNLLEREQDRRFGMISASVVAEVKLLNC